MQMDSQGNTKLTKKQQSSSLQRRVQCYPPPGLYNALTDYALNHGMSSSEAAVYMMRYFFNASHTAASKKADKEV